MILIWGTRLYGKSEVVPGMWHVATRFGHLWYIPLFPVGSSVAVIDENRGIDVPMSGKSILATYIRGWGIPGLIITSIVTLGAIGNKDIGFAIGAGVVSLIILGLIIFSYVRSSWFMSISPERARTIAEQLELTDEGHIMLERALGQIDQPTYEKAIADLHRDRQELAALTAAAQPQHPNTGSGPTPLGTNPYH